MSHSGVSTEICILIPCLGDFLFWIITFTPLPPRFGLEINQIKILFEASFFVDFIQ